MRLPLRFGSVACTELLKYARTAVVKSDALGVDRSHIDSIRLRRQQVESIGLRQTLDTDLSDEVVDDYPGTHQLPVHASIPLVTLAGLCPYYPSTRSGESSLGQIERAGDRPYRLRDQRVANSGRCPGARA